MAVGKIKEDDLENAFKDTGKKGIITEQIHEEAKSDKELIKVKKLALNEKILLSTKDNKRRISLDVGKSLLVGLQDVKIHCTN